MAKCAVQKYAKENLYIIRTLITQTDLHVDESKSTNADRTVLSGYKLWVQVTIAKLILNSYVIASCTKLTASSVDIPTIDYFAASVGFRA